MSNSLNGFRDNVNNGNPDFGYDAYGNMTSDANKRIEDIDYNHLNLPTVINFQNNGGRIRYTYDALGVKVRKEVDEVNGTTTTDYLDGFQYKNEALVFFPTVEGYVEFATPTKFFYVYNYTDHLGNVRMSYTDNGVAVPKILEENHYYPFGLKHENYASERFERVKETNGELFVIQPTERREWQYKYQGQELQDELNLNWDSFKWRNYDFAIGRFMSVDPLAEKYVYNSTYAFAENRVVDGRELEGLEWVNSNGLKVYDPSLNNSKGGFTSAATVEHRNLAKSLNMTDTGKSQFSKLVNSNIPTETILDNKTSPKSKTGGLILANVVPTGVMEVTEVDTASGKSEVVDATVDKMTITFFLKNIDKVVSDANDGDSNQPTGYGKVIPAGTTFSELIGAIFGHEIEHTTIVNVITESNGGDVEKLPTEISNKIINETSEKKNRQ